MTKGYLQFLVGCALSILTLAVAIAQEPLPRGFSPEERLSLATGDIPRSPIMTNVRTEPSEDSDHRSIAEWEELHGIAITWTRYRNILTEIVRHAQRECTVYIITRNEGQTRADLEVAGVDPEENIVYVDADFNSVWIRDYGPNTAYKGDVDSLVLVDWIYNRPRPQDDVVSQPLAEVLDVPLYATVEAPRDLVNTGGNYMSDGMGRGFSSRLVLEENGPGNIFGSSVHDEETVDEIMSEFLGVEEYVKMDILPFDGIHHIDMHMKIIDENTLLVGEYPEGVSDGPQIEANIQYVIENFKTSTGRDYEVVRIPMPPDQFGRYPNAGGYYRTYTNALFINKTILVPTYEERYDTTALRIWEEIAPGYRIKGINCNEIIPAGGAIHCITKEIGVREPLWIWHDSPEALGIGSGTGLRATVKHRSEIHRAVVVYKTGSMADYDSVAMEAIDGEIWEGVPSGLQDGDTLDYYFVAEASTGKRITRPLTAPAGSFSTVVEGETTSARSQVLNDMQIRVFPNPATAITCIQLTGLTESRHLAVELRDATGRAVMQLYEGRSTGDSEKLFFDAGALPSGLYYLVVRADDSISTDKISIAH